MGVPPTSGSRALGERLIELGRERHLRRGEVLFNQRDAAGAVFWVMSGRLRLERHLDRGQVITLGVARAPAVIAEASLFAEQYHCRAVAETVSSISVVPKARVLDLLQADASFAASFVRALATEVRELRHLLELRNIRPAAERLLSYLALEEEQGGAKADRPLVALAAELGLTAEALYRTLAKLERRASLCPPHRPLEHHRPSHHATDRGLRPTPRLPPALIPGLPAPTAAAPVPGLRISSCRHNLGSDSARWLLRRR
jgi:CRP-like cAMP-binding protein